MQIKKAKAEIERLAASGVDIKLVNEGGQPYALVRGLEAPSPPWDRASYDILIVIPIAYDLGTGLDAFYLKQPCKYSGAEHNRVCGQVITYDNSQWKLVSWHYPDDKLFRSSVDTIESHIVHCKGFFWERGNTNART